MIRLARTSAATMLAIAVIGSPKTVKAMRKCRRRLIAQMARLELLGGRSNVVSIGIARSFAERSRAASEALGAIRSVCDACQQTQYFVACEGVPPTDVIAALEAARRPLSDGR